MDKKKILIFSFIGLILILIVIVITLYFNNSFSKDNDDNITIKFYDNNYGYCYMQNDVNCTSLYVDGEVLTDLNEEDFISEYSCNNSSCEVKSVDLNNDVAIIMDGSLFLYNFNGTILEINLNESLENLEFSIINNFDNNYDILINNGFGEYNIYNTQDGILLFNKWHKGSNVFALDNYFVIADEESNQSSIINRSDEEILTLDSYVNDILEYQNYLLFYNRYSYDYYIVDRNAMSYVTNINDNGNPFDIIDNYILFGNYIDYTQIINIYAIAL